MLWRQKFIIFLPALAISIAVAYVVQGLPSVYESTSLLIINPPTITDVGGASFSDEDVSQKLNGITQKVISRSSLEPMIVKYNLYAQERAAQVPMEILVDQMRKKIKVDMERTNNDKVPSFRISFRDRESKNARIVVADLAGKYVDIQTEINSQIANSTKNFYDEQLTEARKQMDVVDKQRLDIMLANKDTLPESSQSLIAQLEGIRKEQETISQQKNFLIAERGRLNDNRQSVLKQIQILQEAAVAEAARQAQILGNVTRTPAYGALIQKRTELTSQLEKLLKQYKEKHPDVVAKRLEIESVNNEIEKLKLEAQKDLDDVKEDAKQKAELRVKSLEIEKAQIEGQIARTDDAIKQQDLRISEKDVQASEIQARLNNVPNVKIALDSLNQQYQTAKTTHDKLLEKKNTADLVSKRETEVKGETIRIVDPANEPQSDVAFSRRVMLMALGAGIGLLLGIILAAILEFPRLMTIETIEDAKYYTKLPVLASVPQLLTEGESRRQKTWQLLRVLGGLAIAVGSIPLLIVVLKMTHIFERFVS
jgi:uncharacterized protein involved in exopolysaccharide biosynthesis